MPLVYITGSAGSGKSTIQKELRQHGFEAYDEDDPEIGSAHEKVSGMAVAVPPAGKRTPEWFAAHEWRVYQDALDRLVRQSKDKLVFLCGNAATEQQLIQLFDEIIFLDIDERTMRERLASRIGNDYGTSEAEVRTIRQRNTEYRELHKKMRSHFIDASQPLDNVVSAILTHVQAA
jgi:dephospho-CoA kinase